MSLELLSSLCFYSFIQQIFAEHLLCNMHFSRPLGSKSMQPTGELHRLSILSSFPTDGKFIVQNGLKGVRRPFGKSGIWWLSLLGGGNQSIFTSKWQCVRLIDVYRKLNARFNVWKTWQKNAFPNLLYCWFSILFMNHHVKY